MFVKSKVRVQLPLDLKSLDYQNLRSWEQEAKNVPGGLVGVILGGTVAFPTP